MQTTTLKERPAKATQKTAIGESLPRRSINLDIIRIVALCCVASVHFFLHNGFYSNTISTLPMNIMGLMRTVFLICVPLFLLLTGYLQGSKKFTPCKQYYFKLTKILGPYLIIMFIDMLYYIIIQKKVYTVREAVENFTSFTHYSWYVEMYIGLFLLIPFLNIIWQKLETKKQEHALLITLIILTILPNTINAYEFDATDWWNSSNNKYWNIFPDWWESFYPITYYFTGAYLSRHKNDMKLKPIYAFLISLGCLGLFGAYALSRVQGIAFSVFAWTNYNSLGIYALAVSVFVFFNSINFSWVPKFLAKFIAKLSDLSFGAYLGTWVIDYLLYPELKKAIPVMDDRLWAYPVTILTVLAGAFIISFGADIICELFTLICKLFTKNKAKAK